MKIRTKHFRANPGKKVKLSKWPTKIKDVYKDDDEYEERLAEKTAELSDMQELLYAHDSYSLLLIFQAMDAAGKDSSIRHVMSGVNPQGCQVFSFKQPSAEELDHDFLWRTWRRLPERGRIGIFNRSYYEEVLVVRVHPEFLEAQRLPDEHMNDKNIWKGRYESIRDMEAHLHRNGTRIIKFYLHLSPAEQAQRFLDRIDEPDKNWKFNAGDVEERQLWKKYMRAYEDAISATTTKDAPWYIVPADDKKNARLIISEIIIETLKGMKMEYPQPTEEHIREMMALRAEIEREIPKEK